VVNTFFIPLGGPKSHDFFGRDDNSIVIPMKGGAEAPSLQPG
jgi:hypothetical protein